MNEARGASDTKTGECLNVLQVPGSEEKAEQVRFAGILIQGDEGSGVAEMTKVKGYTMEAKLGLNAEFENRRKGK